MHPAAAVALFLACSVPAAAVAECTRIQPPVNPGVLDGPGSFGPLDGLVTLDCLKYVGSIEQGGTEYVLIRDERGTVHRLTVGYRMGENSGRITRIDRDTIYVTQYIQHGKGEWKETVVKFPKQPWGKRGPPIRRRLEVTATSRPWPRRAR